MKNIFWGLLGLAVASGAHATEDDRYLFRDEEDPSIFKAPDPIESGPSLDTPIDGHEWQATGPRGYGLSAAFRNFSLSCPKLPSDFNLGCLRQRQNEFLVLDAGHDDTPISMRSEAYLKAGDRDMVFARPLIHEGKLNMATTWMVYELMKKCWARTSEDLEWIDQHVRLSRYPGEKKFGQYGQASGRSRRLGGDIHFDATNRKDWLNTLVADWSEASGNPAAAKTVFTSIHANSSGGVYDSIDMAWMILPKNSSSASRNLGTAMATGLAKLMPDYFRHNAGDSRDVKSLKHDVRPTYQKSTIKVDPHTRDLAMLAPDLGNSQSRKVLLEGFFMDGKAGNLVFRELSAGNKTLFFRRGSRTVAAYHVSDLYIHYAQGVLAGLSELGRKCHK